MFERFTDRAKRVVVLAEEEAKAVFHHSHIGTEHILLGLLHEGEGIAAKVLQSMEIGLDAARQVVGEIMGKGATEPPGHPPFTDRAKAAFGQALRESLSLGHDYIGTEHLLLGLIADGGQLVTRIITDSGHSRGEVRESVLSMVGGPTVNSASQSPQEAHPVEGPEERSLFAKALTLAMGSPDIARTTDPVVIQGIEDYIDQRRARTWKKVTAERDEMRVAAAEFQEVWDAIFPEAIATASRDHPELINLRDEAARQGERISETTAQGMALADTLRQMGGRSLTTDEVGRADEVAEAMRDAIQQGSAWCDSVREARRDPRLGNPSQKTQLPASNRKPTAAGALSRLRRASRPDGRPPAARYQQFLQLLTDIQRLRSDIETERKRADLQLSNAAEKFASQSERYRNAKARAQAAEESLVASLQDAMLPEIRLYLGRS
ncbi:MAG: Clp protease N-terminal domain-containing protein [Streptosporangiaceae bacterium]